MDNFNLNDLVKDYLSGMDMNQVARKHGTTPWIAKQHLLSRNVKIRGRAEAQRLLGKPIPDRGQLVQRYAAGLSIKEIAEELGVGHVWLHRKFQQLGIPIRSTSETARLAMNRPEVASHLRKVRKGKWDRMSPEAQARARAKLSTAMKGRSLSESHKIKMAASRQRTLMGAQPYEAAFAESLRSLGFDPVQQFAVGPYNVDLAFELPGIAVEIDSDSRHFSAGRKPETKKRLEHLFNKGWSVLFIENASSDPVLIKKWLPYHKPGCKPSARRTQCRRTPGNSVRFVFPDVTQKVLAFFEAAGRGKPFHRQYGVILRDGQTYSGRRTDVNGLPRVPGF